MCELSPEARRLVELARNGDDPTDRDEQRIAHALATRRALGLAATTVGLSVVQSTWATILVTASKGTAVVVVGLLAAAAVWSAGTFRRSTAEPAAPASTPAPQQTSPSQRSVVEPVPRVDTVSGASAPENGGAPFSATPPLRTTAPVSRAVPVPAPPPRESGKLEAETAALRDAQRALRAGAPSRALALIAEQDHTYRGGALAQERAALRIFALCSLGRGGESRTEAQRFEQRWPRSPILGRVRTACSAAPAAKSKP